MFIKNIREIGSQTNHVASMVTTDLNRICAYGVPDLVAIRSSNVIGFKAENVGLLVNSLFLF